MDRQGNVVDQIKFGRDSLHLTSNYPKIDNFIVDAANNVIFTGQEAETNWPLRISVHYSLNDMQIRVGVEITIACL